MGHDTDSRDGRVELTSSAHDLTLRFVSAVQRSFGAKPTVRPVAEGRRYRVYFHGRALRALLHSCGLGHQRASEKHVPTVILRSPPAVQAAFLRGLFDADGGYSRRVHLTTASARLAREVQVILLHHGIVSKRSLMAETRPDLDHSEAWRLDVMGAHALRVFEERIGFNHEVKAFCLEMALEATGCDYKTNWGQIPFGRDLARRLRDELRGRGGRNYPEAGGVGPLLSRVVTGAVPLNMWHVAHLAGVVGGLRSLGPAGARVDELHRLGYFFDPVVSIRATRAEVFDLCVPGSHSFIGNGIVNHNSQGSEFPCAVVVMHKAHTFMHHRGLFYTAVTRARETAVVLGDRWGMRNCAAREQVDRRQTFLSLLLDGPESAT